MNKQLMERFLARRRKMLKEAAEEKLTKEDFEEDKEFSIEDYLPAGKDIMKFFVAGTMREKIKATKEILNAMRDEIMDIGEPDDPNFYKEEENIKEFIFDMQDNTGKFGYLLGNKDEEELDEGCKGTAKRRKMLKEDNGLYDKINNYLIKIGEEPLDDEASNKTESAHTRKSIAVTESKKTIKKPTSLLESLNKGFEQIYGNLDDNKRLTEAKETKKKYPIKEFFADHMDELNKIMNNKKSSEKQKKQEILDLLNSSDVSKSQIDQFARKMEATHDWGFYGFIGTYITAQKVNECVNNKKKS